jgi:hypothetical protein
LHVRIKDTYVPFSFFFLLFHHFIIKVHHQNHRPIPPGTQPGRAQTLCPPARPARVPLPGPPDQHGSPCPAARPRSLQPPELGRGTRAASPVFLSCSCSSASQGPAFAFKPRRRAHHPRKANENNPPFLSFPSFLRSFLPACFSNTNLVASESQTDTNTRTLQSPQPQ